MTIQDLRARTINLTDKQRSLILSDLIGRIDGAEGSVEWQIDPIEKVLGMLDRAIKAWEGAEAGS